MSPRSDPGVITVDRLKKPIVVTGNYKGTTEKVIPANLVWRVHHYGRPAPRQGAAW
ncbi:hypothetical protein JQX13_28890 [Archangium violaceum]|uniref:hypothetical protein n=1 Tax=Archangium violaceum TaxID=83451 RepID=UPI00193B9A04|nr:hypothetical protein [Archangium violaceum]QRK04280.1 hypothetical protein JQX13_28890 [Archangium violaceum]